MTNERDCIRLEIDTDDAQLCANLESSSASYTTFALKLGDGPTTPPCVTLNLELTISDEESRNDVAAFLFAALKSPATGLRMDGAWVPITEAAIRRFLAPRNLILCSDGTGNAGGKTRGTNVWRLFNYIDWHHPTVEQRPFYNDGVGTDSWRPLKIIGGTFGWGLSANIRELYAFAAQNFRAGDRLYFFGFSRGAFTVRSAVGLINTCGLLTCASYLRHPELVKELLRIYRLADNGKRKAALEAFRNEHGAKVRDIPIRCIGVWDTVDAVGMPVDELKPIVSAMWEAVFGRRLYGFRDYNLHCDVEYGFHALSLDDERKTFHPNVWNQRDNVEQVWFAGAHSNVGGGYAKDSLSYVSLDWMMGKVAGCGVRFVPVARAEVQALADAHGKHHDSRSGTGTFYRYEPRDPEMKKPKKWWWKRMAPRLDYNNAAGTGALIEGSQVHVSVYERIQRSTAGYVPLFVPHLATVACTDAPIDAGSGAPDPWANCSGPKATGLPCNVRNDIRRLVRARARLYWLFIAYALLLLFLAGLSMLYPEAAARESEWSQRTDGPVRQLLEVSLPAFLEPVIALGARYFPWAVGALFLLALFRFASTAMRDGIVASSRTAWAQSLGMPISGTGTSIAFTWVGQLQESLGALRRGLAWLTTLLVGQIPAGLTRVLTLLAVLVVLVDLLRIPRWEPMTGIGAAGNPTYTPTECDGACVDGALGRGDFTLVSFRADRSINHSGIELIKDAAYGVEYVGNTPNWRDRTINPPPGGFAFGRNLIGLPPFWWISHMRPNPSGNWFEVLGQIAGTSHVRPLLNPEAPTAARRFTAEKSGELLLFVNDVLYDNNSGVMTLRIARVDED